MKKEFNIEEIKCLLCAYYDGTTTVAEEQLLRKFFSEDANIPPELEADRQLFSDIDKATVLEMGIPTNLEAELTQHIDKLADAGMRKRHWITRYKNLSIAASVALLLTTGVFVAVNSGNGTTGENSIVIAENNDTSTIIEEVASVELADTATIAKERHQKVVQEAKQAPTKAKTSKKRAKRKRVIPVNQLKTASEEYIAYENTERALLLLSENLNKAKEGVTKTEATINEVNNTIIDII